MNKDIVISLRIDSEIYHKYGDVKIILTFDEK